MRNKESQRQIVRLLDWLYGNKTPKPKELLAAANFTAVDVETANVNKASICQIGVVRFRSGEIEDVWETLVNPAEYFDAKFVAIHGIDTERVSNAPKFPDIYDELSKRLSGIVVSYSQFDRFALYEAAHSHSLRELNCIWLDVRSGGLGSSLRDEADVLGIAFDHHDAKEDARVAGEILVNLINTRGLKAEQLLSMMEYDFTPSLSRSGLTAKTLGYKG
ncbi:MAG: hypothetical protein IIC23_07905, partial [Chloroflexi bacterium]|nr:hypothetical protein [Chloroflexota bacterium]